LNSWPHGHKTTALSLRQGSTSLHGFGALKKMLHNISRK
jgi:hypothetical protein